MIGAAWLAIKAWGLWGRLAGAVASLWVWATRNPAWALCAALAALCGLLWHERDIKARQVAHLTAQAAEFRAAQVEAGRLAQEALHHQEAVYQAKAQDADHAYQTQLAAAQSAADRYIAGHRVRSSAGQSDAGSAIASPQGSSAKGSDGPGTAPDMVAVTAGDIQVCTVNTERLEAVRDWAITLNN